MSVAELDPSDEYDQLRLSESELLLEVIVLAYIALAVTIFSVTLHLTQSIGYPTLFESVSRQETTGFELILSLVIGAASASISAHLLLLCCDFDDTLSEISLNQPEQRLKFAAGLLGGGLAYVFSKWPGMRLPLKYACHPFNAMITPLANNELMILDANSGQPMRDDDKAEVIRRNFYRL